jgi:c-di-GMP-binding flagellar brake protein YcgR
MMEHRLDSRIQAPINVIIQTGKRSTFKTRANNLSRGGMNVEMDTAWGIKEMRLVFIEFMEEWLSAKIPALVVQTTAISASLMFIEHSPEVHSFLSYRNG